MESKESTEVRAETSEAGTLTAEPEVPQGCPAGAPAPQPIWASRSRKSIRAEEALQKELERCNSLRSRAEDAIRGLTEEKERALKLLKGGEAWSDAFLSDTLRKIEEQERMLAEFTGIAAKAQANLDSFRADVAAYAPERARIQDNLVALAGARLEIDCELQKLLSPALAMLQVRRETIACMRKQAAAIELQCDFEAGVPASLHEALSLDIVSASKAWNAEFLAQAENLKPYVVCDDDVELKETLARKAVYHFGETVFVLEEEARELLRDDRPQGSGFGWECLPPTLMTAEAFAAVQAEAGPMGKLMKYVLRQKHEKLQQKRREAYLLERRGTPVPNARLHFGGP